MGQKKPNKFFWLSAGVNDWGDLDGNLILMRERDKACILKLNE